MTPLPEPGAPDVLYLIDLSCWVHRFYATVGSMAAHRVVEWVGKLIDRQRPAYLAAALDLPWPTFRHQLAPKVYKAQREAPDATLLERARWAREMLEDVHGVPMFSARGYEADDVLATLTERALEAGLRVVILAYDKDLLQLVRDRVVMWDGKALVMGEAEVVAKFGVRPVQLRDYLALVGDVSDNVPGVKGVGPKAAVELLQAATLDNALAFARAGDVLPRVRPRLLELLREYEADALLSQRLVTLAYDLPLPVDFKALRAATREPAASCPTDYPMH